MTTSDGWYRQLLSYGVFLQVTVLLTPGEN